jgi:RNA polymerase sigma-70 factor (ECF subfamily)
MDAMSRGRAGDLEGELERDPGEGAQLIVARLREGDPTALRELYQQEERRAFALAYRVLRDAAAAEDAVQEAFTQLWERAGQLTLDGGRVESLLMTIVRRRAVDHARRRGRAGHPLPNPDLLQQVDEQASELLERVEEKLTTDGLRLELNAALERLPEEQRRIVNHAYFGNLTLRAIAEREGLPLGTVKSRLRLGMTKLTETMKRQRDR